MQQLKAIIVDDEESAIKTLVDDLIAFPEIKIIETFLSAEKAKSAIIKQQPDLLFLDVEISQTNGIDFLQEIRSEIHSNMCVVFYSAFEKYMLDAFRNSAFDYLLKPYELQELSLIIGRVKEKLQAPKSDWEQSLKRLLPLEQKITFHGITGLVLLKPSAILYFTYLKDLRCWKMIQINGTEHKLRTSINSKDILSQYRNFIQINQVCILNIDYLDAIENNTLNCILSPGINLDESLSISRRYYAKVRENLDII